MFNEELFSSQQEEAACDSGVEYWNLGIFFTKEFWWPPSSSWQSHNLLLNESTFDTNYFAANLLTKVWFNLECVRRSDFVKDFVSFLYKAPDPNIGEMPCFMVVDPKTYPNSTLTTFKKLNLILSSESKEKLLKLTLCEQFSGDGTFIYWFNAFFFIPKLFISPILQPLLCHVYTEERVINFILRVLVFFPEECEFKVTCENNDEFWCLSTLAAGFLIIQVLLLAVVIIFFNFCLSETFRRVKISNLGQNVEHNKTQIHQNDLEHGHLADRVNKTEHNQRILIKQVEKSKEKDDEEDDDDDEEGEGEEDDDDVDDEGKGEEEEDE
jgi:hypothetical protein